MAQWYRTACHLQGTKTIQGTEMGKVIECQNKYGEKKDKNKNKKMII